MTCPVYRAPDHQSLAAGNNLPVGDASSTIAGWEGRGGEGAVCTGQGIVIPVSILIIHDYR